MRHIHRLAYAYLIIPFIIFCMGWLRLFFAIPITILILWTFWQTKPITNCQLPIANSTSRIPLYALLITGLWVCLSGVGGYAFQNWDHHWRNAVLHDLINYNLPVIYSSPERGPIKMLVYYVGYWLPSALAGKAFGWRAANFVLFLWTWLGVFLATLRLNLKLKTALTKTALLFIFFSGMDALGVLIHPSDYPTLFPPIQHLEIWADKLQYSSFTTQLFWTFNQAVPAWLCIALVLETDSSLSEKIFIWSLCFFFAPLIAVGLLPYLLIDFIEQINNQAKNPRSPAFVRVQNLYLIIASVVIVAVSYFYFSTNAAAQERGFQSFAVKDFLVFFLLEGGILWLLLAPRLWRDPRWMVTGVLLFFTPFIQLGNGQDFMMRASIAPLFYLMSATGEILFHATPSPRILRVALYALFLIGAMTPLYEINRSIDRTYQWYFALDETQRAHPPPERIAHLEQAGALEAVHPNTLVADDVQTLQFMSDELSKNFIANVRQSFFYRYLSSH